MYLATHVFNIRSDRRNPARRGKPTIPLPPEPDPEEAEISKRTPDLSAVGTPPASVLDRKPAKPWFAALMLLIATIGTAWNSELLVQTIRPVTLQIGWSPVFIGLVIIPIVGNAAEHSSALYIAIRDRVDLCMAIALGSSVQVATLVAPLLVLISLFYRTKLDLVFQPLELVILALATVLFTFISLDGESYWLEGSTTRHPLCHSRCRLLLCPWLAECSSL